MDPIIMNRPALIMFKAQNNLLQTGCLKIERKYELAGKGSFREY